MPGISDVDSGDGLASEADGDEVLLRASVRSSVIEREVPARFAMGSSVITSDEFRDLATRFLCQAERECNLTGATLAEVLVDGVDHSHGVGHGALRYRRLALLADEILSRPKYTSSIVDGFYVRAKRGQGGEQTFINGEQALAVHGYAPDVVSELPAEVTHRFLGLGNVWRDITAVAGMKIVDIGCGAGLDLSVAGAICDDVSIALGVDTRTALLGLAGMVNPRATFIAADVKALPLSAGRFDVVIANGLPPLLRPDTLADTARILLSLARPGGTVAATVLVASSAAEHDIEGLVPTWSEAPRRELVSVLTGKPTRHDVARAFATGRNYVSYSVGANPYLDPHARYRTAALTVTVRAT